MIPFIQQLIADVEQQLDRVAEDSATPLETSAKSIAVLQQAIGTITTFSLNHSFTQPPEEIDFYKTEVPAIYSRLIYFIHLFHFESRRAVPGSALEKKQLQEELDKMDAFISDHQEFYGYYHSGSKDLDDIYFRRGSSLLYYLKDDDSIFIDPRHCTAAGFRIAKFKAYELLQHYFLQLQRSEAVPVAAVVATSKKNSWTDAKSGLIELLYALYATGAINHGKATVKDIAVLLEQALNVNLSNYYRAIQNMRIRKINRTKFLDLLKSNLEKYMDGVDEWGKG